MSLRNGFVAAVLIATAGISGVEGAPRHKSNVDIAPTPPPVLPVEQGRISEEIANEKEAEPKFASFELTASSYEPKNIHEVSQISGATGYTTDGPPALRFRFEQELWRHDRTLLNGGFGVGFFQMKRTVSFSPVGGATQLGDQSLYLISLPIAFELVPGFLRYKGLSAHLGAGVMPTFYVSSRSVMNDGESHFLLPIEVSAGLAFDLPWNAVSGLGLVIDLARVIPIGNGPDLSGWAVRGGLRLLHL